ncbi:DUF4330 family protein [Synechococcales cyanobacterium C]|uniref:DUF4330 family protein n=1 Tax=Petrachloros mirabilis ULC683 TaxID=2781853 RepID=A0A8K1ZWY6_9CYAN|nr:DUF4330 domain-containing protein [Petrachloros mirabilis]NCJ05561.1 DUF4330 family protein [Petrachloros mirabilis ULC683]
MALLDARGRLFGKINLFDIGAVLIMLMVIAGFLVTPSPSGTSLAQVGVTTQPVEVDVLVMGLSSRSPDLLKAGEKTNFIIRNQPYGQVDITRVDALPRTVTASQPDGSVKALDDPRPEMQFSRNFLLTLEGRGQLIGDEPVLGNIKIKVGTPVDLEGKRYSFRASVIDVRVGN